MKSKKSNYFFSIFLIVTTIAAFALFTVLLNILENQLTEPSDTPKLIYLKILYNIVRCTPLLLIFIPYPYFEKVVFDEYGVTFKRFFKTVGFFSWHEIESVSVIYGAPFRFKGQEITLPYVIAITKNHRTIPTIAKRGCVTNRDENGKKLKFNRDKSPLAWIFGIGASCSDLFVEHVKRYRPELLKQKNKNLSCIGYD